MTTYEQSAASWQVAAFMIGGALPLKVFGPAVTTVWCLLGILFGLVAMGQDSYSWQRWQKLLSKKIVWFIAAFIAYLGLISFQAYDQYQAQSRWQDLLALSAGALLLGYVLQAMPKKQVRYLLNVLVVTTLIVAAFVALDLMFTNERLARALHGHAWQNIGRAEDMSSILAVLMPWVWVVLLKRAKEGSFLSDRLGLLASVFLFLTIFPAGGLPGWVGAIAAGVVFLLFGGLWHGVVMHRWHWVGLPILLVAGTLAYGLKFGWHVLLSDVSVLWQVKQTVIGQLGARLEVWQHALTQVPENWLFGVGLNNFRLLPLPYTPFPSVANPHNFLLEGLVESGVIGLGAMLTLIYMVFARMWRYVGVNLYAVAGLASLTAFWVCSLAEFSVYQPWWVTYFVFTSILALRLCRHGQER